MLKFKDQVSALGTTLFLTGVAVGLGAYLVLREAFDKGAIEGTGMALKDWSSVWLAALAFLFSLLAFFHHRHSAKQDAFYAVHEKLIAFDIQEGRRILFGSIKTVEDVAALERDCLDGFQKVNRALGMYDVLGMQVAHKYVYKSTVLEEWGRNLARARTPALLFMAHRQKSWDHFDKLSAEALKRYGAKSADSAPETK